MKKLIFFICLLFLTNLQFAQDTLKHKIKEVVVTATKIETPLSELASSTTVLTETEISNLNKTTVLDILRDLPGISVSQAGGMGKIGSLFLRGGNSNHVLVLVDGIEVNDPSSPGNSFDFAYLQSDDIRRIEIIRGPQSTLYGSDAMAGVINIYTKTPSEKSKVNLFGEAGSYSFFKFSAGASGKLGMLGYSIIGNRTTSGGISAAAEKYGNSETDNFKSTIFSGKLTYSILENLNAEAFYKYTNASTGLDQSGKFGDDPNFNYDAEENLLKAGLSGNFFRGALTSKLSTSLIRKISHAIDEPDAAHAGLSMFQFNNASRLKTELENHYRFSESTVFAFGFEYETEKAETEYKSTSSWGSYNSIFPRSEMGNAGLYLLLKTGFDGKFFLSSGMRYDKNSQFGGKFTYRLAPAYYISSTRTKIKFTYGTGFKAPSLFNLFDPLYGNPELKPERSAGWDAGIEQTILDGTLYLEVVYFRTDYTDLVDFDQNFKPVNISKARTSGFEISANYTGIPGLTADVNLTLLEAKDENPDIPAENNDLYRRPGRKLNFTLNYNVTKSLSLRGRYKLIGVRYDLDFNAFPSRKVELPEYSLFNFTVSYELNEMFKLFLRAENVFDQYYEDVLYYGTYGRSIYSGVKINL